MPKIISFLKLLFINPKNPTYFGTKITSSVRVLERKTFSMLLDSHTSQAAVKPLKSDHTFCYLEFCTNISVF